MRSCAFSNRQLARRVSVTRSSAQPHITALSEAPHLGSANIQNPGTHIVLSPSVSSGAEQLIRELLLRCPTERLGCRSGGARDVKKSRWFCDFEFDALLAGRIAPPYTPTVTGIDDLSHFEVDDELAELDMGSLLWGDPCVARPGEWDEHF